MDAVCLSVPLIVVSWRVLPPSTSRKASTRSRWQRNAREDGERFVHCIAAVGGLNGSPRKIRQTIEDDLDSLQY